MRRLLGKLRGPLLQFHDGIGDAPRKLEAEEDDEDDADHRQQGIGDPHGADGFEDEVIGHRDAEDPVGGGNGHEPKHLFSRRALVDEVALVVLNHLVEMGTDARQILDAGHLLGSPRVGEDQTVLVEDDAFSLRAPVFRFAHPLAQHIQADVRADGPEELSVGGEGRHRGNHQLLGVLVHVRLREDHLSRLFHVIVPRAGPGIQAGRAVPRVVGGEVSVLHADVDVQDLLVGGCQRQHFDGLDARQVAVESRYEIGLVGGGCPLFHQPAVEILSLFADGDYQLVFHAGLQI